MLRTRIIPALLLRDESLVKTVRFGKYTYVGDPCNTARIFNDLEVDELMLLDILATRAGRLPNREVIAELAAECFMPLAYGGGVCEVAQAQAILRMGVEKVVVNSAALARPALIRELAGQFGSQAVVVSIDVKRDLFGRARVWARSGRQNSGRDPGEWAEEAQALGAGEVLLTSIDREGTWAGFDLGLLRRVTSRLQVPVIAHGGAGSVADIAAAVDQGGASAVALGSLVVFQRKGMGILVNYPDLRAFWQRSNS